MRISVNEEPNEKEDYIVEAPYEEAIQAADCELVINDLIEVILLSKKILDKSNEPQKDDHEIKAFWMSAVVTYIKCFNHGTRYKIDSRIYELIPGAVDAHEYFKDIRNKYIAHSIGALENSKTLLVLSPKIENNLKFLRVSSFNYRQLYPALENIQTLISLAEEAKKVTAEFRERMLAEVAQKAANESIEVLYALPYASMTIPGRNEIRSNRKKSKTI